MSKKALTIAVASGKGGVGKSMLASSLILLLSEDENIVAIDSDVDAPNLHLWLGGVKQWDQIKKLSLTEKAKVVNPEFDCENFNIDCQFGAIKCLDNQLEINPFLCDGCGLCQEILGKKRIKMEKVVNGEIRLKEKFHGFSLISGQLYPGETGSGKIVDEIVNYGLESKAEIKIIDVPAGTGCPVTAALKESDLVLLVTEPTETGWSDLKKVLNVVDEFNLDWRLVINKFTLDKQKTNAIKKWADERYLGKLSYDKKVFDQISQLKPIVYSNLKIKKEIKEVYQSFYNWIKSYGF